MAEPHGPMGRGEVRGGGGGGWAPGTAAEIPLQPPEETMVEQISTLHTMEDPMKDIF